MSRFKAFVGKFNHDSRYVVVAGITAVLVAIGGGAAFATRSASDHFADAALDKLGGDSDEILDAIAEKVVDKLASKGGTFDSAQADLVDKLAGMAGEKFGDVDPDKLIDQMRGQVMEAGLGKLDGISTDAIVAQVTAALIAQASAMLEDVDVEALAKAAITDVIKSLDLDKLVKEKIDSIDVEKLVNNAVAKQFGSSSSGTGSLTGLLSMLKR